MATTSILHSSYTFQGTYTHMLITVDVTDLPYEFPYKSCLLVGMEYISIRMHERKI